MTVFIAIAALLTLLVVAWVVRPLLRPVVSSAVSAERLNATIHRDQLEALDRDLARGVISPADFETTRDELQLRLLDDTQEAAAPASASGPRFWTGQRTALVIMLLLPLGTAGGYAWLGTPDAIDPVAAAKMDEAKVNEMVATLAARLKANPNDANGWAMLARSYKVMKRFDDAAQAFAKAGDVINTNPDMLVEYADLLAMQASDNIEGRPLELVNKALALDPQHPMALMMSGVAAYRRAEYPLAVAQWEKLLAVIDPGSPDAQQIEADIADARSKAGMPGKPTSLRPTGAADAAKLPPVDAAAAGAMTPEKINQMVEGLAAKMKANPGDLPGWAKLGRAYKVLGKLPEAEDAYTKAGKLVDSDADLLIQFADVLAMRAGNKLEGRPMVMVNKALVLNPKHPAALMMAGSDAYAHADYVQAVKRWEMVLTVLPPGSKDAALVQAEIADARSKGGLGLQLKP
jgi:cytochrome c-type biogenesis protein CcmH